MFIHIFVSGQKTKLEKILIAVKWDACLDISEALCIFSTSRSSFGLGLLHENLLVQTSRRLIFH